MQNNPSDVLIALLDRLKLAAPRDLRAARRPARRLARDLPMFDSVWVDALQQSRCLTAYQATEINAGRGDALRVGPFVIEGLLAAPPAAQCYRARDLETARSVRLVVAPCAGDPAAPLAALEESIRAAAALRSAAPHSAPDAQYERPTEPTPTSRGAAAEHLVPFERCGVDGSRLWAAGPPIEGLTAAEWLIHVGRFPPQVVMAIARQMVALFAACEAVDFVHGDISTRSLALDPLGSVKLLDAGLRSAVRPTDAGTLAALEPEAYDYLAPERARSAVPANTASEIFACGAVWWHLLAGRSPRAGATGKMRRAAAQSGMIRDIYPIAPDTPRALIETIRLCTERRAEDRPASFAEVAELLGPPTERGTSRITEFVSRGASPPERLVRRVRTMRRSPHAPTWAAAAGGVLLAVSLTAWPLCRSLLVRPTPAEKSQAPQASVAAPSIAEVSPRATPSPVPAVAVAPPQRNNHLPTPASGAPRIARESPAAAAPTAPRTGPIALVSAEQPLPPRPTMRSASHEFVISAAQPLDWSEVRPLPGQVVCARAGERAQIVLPPGGASFAVEHVRFVDIDFITPQGSVEPSASLVVTSRRVTFHRCTFGSRDPSDTPRALLGWAPPAANAATEATNRLELSQCTIGGAGTALRVRPSEAAAIELKEVLFVGAGALLRVDGGSAARASLNVDLTHCTVRGASTVVELEGFSPALGGGTSSQQEFGTPALRIAARECVLAPAKNGAIVLLRGAPQPSDSLRNIAWRGEGTLILPATPIVQSVGSDGQRRTAADAHLPVEGLIRTELGFAGLADEGADASCLVRWQVPLRASEPPGIPDGRLPTLPR